MYIIYIYIIYRDCVVSIEVQHCLSSTNHGSTDQPPISHGNSEAVQFASKELKRDPEVLLKVPMWDDWTWLDDGYEKGCWLWMMVLG